ncbi:MAG: carboxypeptidase-like regulatory domain-containing protein [Sedimentisphaerales bacterium]|nr:carboxypeptidase-like regulatory domain-containing protein [Sedimentisphaerales bacterium]
MQEGLAIVDRYQDKADDRQILRALEMIARVRPSERSTQRAMAAVRRRLLEEKLPARPVIYRILVSPAFRVAVAACIIGGLGLVVFFRPGSHVPGSPPVAGTTSLPAGRGIEELAKQIERLQAVGDADGLTDLVLADLPLEVRMEAARRLVQLDGDKARWVLSRLTSGPEGQVQGPLTQILSQAQPGLAEGEGTPQVPAVAVDNAGQPVTPMPAFSGRLLDAFSGGPVAGAELVLEGPQVLQAQTGPDGSFAFASPVSPGHYHINIRSDHYMDPGTEAEGGVVTLGTDGPLVMDIYAEPGFVVYAQVQDENGSPVPGADLIASWLGQVQANDVASARTDPQGKARLGPLRQQAVAYQIAAVHKDYAPQRVLVECSDCNGPQQAKIVLTKGGSITGYARYADGSPADGILIYALPQWWHSNTLPEPAATSPEGLFVLGQVLSGPLVLKAGIPQPDGRISTITVGQLDLRPEAAGPVAITVPARSLLDQVALCGTIHWTGSGIGQYVDLLAYSVPGTIVRQRLQGQARTFALLGLSPGSYTLVFEGPNIQERVIGPVSVPGPDLQVTFSYVPRPRLQGMVFDTALGRPVQRFRVALAKQRRWPGLTYQVMDLQWHEFEDPNGRFEVPTEGPALYRVYVKADGYVPGMLDAVDLGTDAGVFIQLARGGGIRGRVVDRDGRPVNGATVVPVFGRQIIGPGQEQGLSLRDYRAISSDGQFLIEHLPAGIYAIQIQHPGFATAVLEGLEVMEGRQTDGPTVTLTEGAMVEGLVFDWAGQPRPNLTVRFSDAETSYDQDQADAAVLAVVQTDQDGRYRVEHLPQSACWVQWQDGQYSTSRLIRPVEGKNTRLDLGLGARLTGVVAMKGQPNPGQAVLLADPTSPRLGHFAQRTLCAEDGRFTFFGVPAGRYGLYAQGNMDPARWVLLAVVDVEEQGVDLGTLPGRMASVEVGLAGSAAGPEWKVYLRQGQGLLGQLCGQIDQSQGQAHYTIDCLLPGEYTLVAEDPTGTRYVTRPIVIEKAEVHQVVLEVPAGNSSISGMILGQIDRPLYLNNGQSGLWVRIDPKDGYYNIRGLPAGTYTVGNLFLQEQLPLARFELAPGQNRILDLNPLRWPGLGHGLLSVQVSTTEGLMVKDASVWLDGKETRIGPVYKTDTEYVFVAPAGRYELWVTGPGLTTAHRQVVIQANDLLAVFPVRPVVQVVLDHAQNPSNEP